MAHTEQQSPIEIGPWTFDPSLNELHHLDGPKVKLEDKISLLLVTLVSHRGNIVSKEELINQVWQGRELSEQTIPVAISKLRKALGDDINKPTMLETIPRQGYRLLPIEDGVEVPQQPTPFFQWPLAAVTAVFILAVGWFSFQPEEKIASEQIQRLNAEKPGVIVTINDVRTTEATEDQGHLAIAVSELSAYYLSQISDLLVIRHWWKLDAPDPTGGIFTRYGPATPVYSLKGTLLQEGGEHLVTFVLSNPRNDEIIWSGLHRVDEGSAVLFPLFETMLEELSVENTYADKQAPEESVAFWRARYFLELANPGAAQLAATDISKLLAENSSRSSASWSTALALAARWKEVPEVAATLAQVDDTQIAKSIKDKQNEAESHLLLVDRAAVALFSRNEPQDALNLLEEALLKAPGDHYAISLRGEAHARLGQMEKALTDFRLAYRLAPYAKSHSDRLNELEKLETAANTSP